MSHKTNGHYYIVKMDVSKFFPSIDKDVLFTILSKRMVDPALIELTRVIIFDGEPHDGLPIGDLASQYFANIYLNELDWYCKSELHAKFYIRYMDDIIMIAQNKKEAVELYNGAKYYMEQVLNLRLNSKSRVFRCGVLLDFVGYRTGEDFRLLRMRTRLHCCCYSIDRHDSTSGCRNKRMLSDAVRRNP